MSVYGLSYWLAIFLTTNGRPVLNKKHSFSYTPGICNFNDARHNKPWIAPSLAILFNSTSYSLILELNVPPAPPKPSSQLPLIDHAI